MRFLVHHLVEQAAAETPDAAAVSDMERELNYAELDARSNQLARLLIEHGVRRGDRVGIYLNKSIESLVAVYAIMKAGAAYVPFDPEAPPSRLAYIARNCQLRVVLTGEEKRSKWPELMAARAGIETFFVLNARTEEDQSGARVMGSQYLDSLPEASPEVDVVDQDLAYILYTSGSTGDPKGVMLTHRNALAFVDWAAEEFSVSGSDRLSSHAPLHFDLSVFDLYAAAWAGASVVLVPSKISLFPPQLARFIDSEGITVWYSVPSVLTMLTLRGGLSVGDLPSLRTVLFAGEVFPSKHLFRLMTLLPHVRFANLYGPTETNVCTWYEVTEPPNPDEDIPIGKAILNDDVFAVADDGRNADIGETGELYVRGATVMRGYWGDPQRTASSLVADPRSASLGDPVYKTGDLVEVLRDEGFRYIGRRDSQVKTRGYRVELGEIESAINSHPGVTESAVIAVPDDVVTNRLVAYLVADGVTTESIVSHCRSHLPRYMVPDIIESVDRLPKTSTGKLDRQRLQSEASRSRM